jgi:hypothetical protein
MFWASLQNYYGDFLLASLIIPFFLFVIIPFLAWLDEKND